MQTCRPSVLLVGAIDFHEFREAVGWLRAHTQLAAVRTVAEALERCENRQAFWHTIIIAQSRPGQFVTARHRPTEPSHAAGSSDRAVGQLLRRGDTQRTALAWCGAGLLASVCRPCRDRIADGRHSDQLAAAADGCPTRNVPTTRCRADHSPPMD